jgi:hypothetical protein
VTRGQAIQKGKKKRKGGDMGKQEIASEEGMKLPTYLPT